MTIKDILVHSLKLATNFTQKNTIAGKNDLSAKLKALSDNKATEKEYFSLLLQYPKIYIKLMLEIHSFVSNLLVNYSQTSSSSSSFSQSDLSQLKSEIETQYQNYQNRENIENYIRTTFLVYFMEPISATSEVTIVNKMKIIKEYLDSLKSGNNLDLFISEYLLNELRGISNTSLGFGTKSQLSYQDVISKIGFKGNLIDTIKDNQIKIQLDTKYFNLLSKIRDVNKVYSVNGMIGEVGGSLVLLPIRSKSDNNNKRSALLFIPGIIQSHFKLSDFFSAAENAKDVKALFVGEFVFNGDGSVKDFMLRKEEQDGEDEDEDENSQSEGDNSISFLEDDEDDSVDSSVKEQLDYILDNDEDENKQDNANKKTDAEMYAYIYNILNKDADKQNNFISTAIPVIINADFKIFRPAKTSFTYTKFSKDETNKNLENKKNAYYPYDFLLASRKATGLTSVFKYADVDDNGLPSYYKF